MFREYGTVFEDGKTESDNVFELFKNGQILARAMDEPYITLGAHGFELEFESWKSELKLLLENKLTSASSTLLMEGKGIPTYKTIGLLFDSEKVAIEHVSETDSSSNGNIADGNFKAGNTDLGSLESLRKIMNESKKRLPMNEVNATFNLESLVGFFIVKATNKLDLFSQIFIPLLYFVLKTGKTSLPLVIYDPKEGTIEEQKITLELINEMVSFLKDDKLQIYKNALSNFSSNVD